MERSQREGRTLRHAAARAALWLYNYLPVLVEALLFPDNTRTQVSAIIQQSALAVTNEMSVGCPIRHQILACEQMHSTQAASSQASQFALAAL